MASTITDRVNGVATGAMPAGGIGYYTATGVAGVNTLTGDLDPGITTGYRTNMIVYFRPVSLNTGPVDVNWMDGGQVNLLTAGGAELAANDLNPALEYSSKFNGTEFRILGSF